MPAMAKWGDFSDIFFGAQTIEKLILLLLLLLLLLLFSGK